MGNLHIDKWRNILKRNRDLLSFISLSYFDKAVIFLVPLVVLYFFKDKAEYVAIEYIYSLVLVIIPFLDIGLTGYFYYHYRTHKNKRQSIVTIFSVFYRIYSGLFLVGVLLITIHYFVIPFEEYVIYIVFRALFLVIFAFLSSYYRLIDNAKKALFVTLTANAISLLFLATYLLSSMPFNLMAVFIGQILFCIYFFYKTLSYLKRHITTNNDIRNRQIIKAALLFSWPTIIQVFLLMIVANYGKINSINSMTLNEAALLSLTQRYAALIHLTHTALLAFLIKDIFLSKQFEIKLSILKKYLILLICSAFLVVLILLTHWYFNSSNIESIRVIYVSIGLILYTILWCLYAYLEIYYGIENKNIIKLYLALLTGGLFVLIINVIPLPFLERITLGMLVSILVSLIVSGVILNRRKYYFS